MTSQTLGPDYFARIYEAASDPWDFASSNYEHAKYRATIDALDGRNFRSGFEIGCSIGVLTAQLAAHCDQLLSIDVNERALNAARERCASLAQVRFEQMMFPRQTPTGCFDLVVVSEVGYYWSDDDLGRAIDAIATHASGGTLELVHFLPKVDDYLRDGDAVHAAFLADSRYVPIVARRAERYRLDVLNVR